MLYNHIILPMTDDSKSPFEVVLPLPFDQTLALVEQAMRSEGYVILIHLDIQHMMAERMQAEMGAYMLISARDQVVTAMAVESDPGLALMVPCNIALEAYGPAETLVRAADAGRLTQCNTGSNQAIDRLAAEASRRMRALIASLPQKAAILTGPGNK